MKRIMAGLLATASLHAAAQAQSLSEDEAAVLRGELDLLQEAMLAAEADNDQEIEALRARAARQDATIAALTARLDAMTASEEGPRSDPRQAASQARAQTPAPTTRSEAVAAASAPMTASVPIDGEAAPEAVGEAPPAQATQPRIQIFSDVGGILTPRGDLILEPSFAYTTTSDNRFFFSGAEIVDALLIGLIEARDTQRTSLSFTPQVRYGLTSRLEADVSVPFIHRTDQRRGDDISVSDGMAGPGFVRDLEASGLGDVSLGLHYQLNQGKRWPYLIANLRAKAPTGTGPLNVAFDEDGNPTEAATGSGYWSVEPSISVIKRLDPVALFANVGYQWNLEDDLDTTLRGLTYQSVDPGDAVRTSMGLGLAPNETVNVSLGYDQSYVFASEARVIDEDGALNIIRGQATTVGSFLFGVNVRVSPKLNVGFNAGIGATDEAPDVNLRVRARYAY